MEHAVSLIWCVPASSDSPSHTSLTAEVCVCVSCGLSSDTRPRRNHRISCTDLGVHLWKAFKCLKYTESAGLFIVN